MKDNNVVNKISLIKEIIKYIYNYNNIYFKNSLYLVIDNK